jgi:hypothetical protein
LIAPEIDVESSAQSDDGRRQGSRRLTPGKEPAQDFLGDQVSEPAKPGVVEKGVGYPRMPITDC